MRKTRMTAEQVTVVTIDLDAELQVQAALHATPFAEVDLHTMPHAH